MKTKQSKLTMNSFLNGSGLPTPTGSVADSDEFVDCTQVVQDKVKTGPQSGEVVTDGAELVRVGLRMMRDAAKVEEQKKGVTTGSLPTAGAVGEVGARNLSLGAITDLTFALSYLRVIKVEWSLHAASVLGCSPTFRDLFDYLSRFDQAFSPDGWDSCELVEVFGEGMSDVWYQFRLCGDSGASQFIEHLFHSYKADPDDVLMTLRAGNPDMATSFPGMGMACSEQLYEWHFLRSGSKEVYLPGIAPLIMEVNGHLGTHIGMTGDSDVDRESERRGIAADVLWASDRKELEDGQCYLACFKPSAREFVRAQLGSKPPARSFLFAYAVGAVRGWLVDLRWYLTATVEGRCHLLRGEHDALVSLESMVDAMAMGSVGHKYDTCSRLSPITGLSAWLCDLCRNPSKPEWTKANGGLVHCACQDVVRPKLSVHSKYTIVKHTRKASSREFDDVLSVKVTAEGREWFQYAGAGHVPTVETGQIAMVQLCDNFALVNRKPAGVESFLIVHGRYVEAIVPPGLRVYVAGTWLLTDKVVSVVGEITLAIGFQVAAHSQCITVKSRDGNGWIRWHHTRALSSPTSTEQYLWNEEYVDLIVYGGIRTKKPVDQFIAMESDERTGIGKKRFNSGGVYRGGLHGTVVAPIEHGAMINDQVFVNEGIRLGVSSHVHAVDVRAACTNDSCDGAYCGLFTMIHGQDAEAIDNGWSDDDSADGYWSVGESE